MSEAVPTDDGANDLEVGVSDDAAVSILTSGKPIRCLTRLPTAVVNEAKVRFDADGLHIRAVDPANVGLIELTAHAEGFEAWRMPDEDEEIVVGMSLPRLTNALGWARMRGDGDPVSIDVLTDPTRIRVSVTRPDQSVQRTTEWFGIDPDSIRKEPDLPNLELPCVADPDIVGFHDAVAAFEDDYAAVEYDASGSLVLRADLDDDGEERVTFPNAAWVDGDEDDALVGTSSMFSLSYLEDMAKAVKRSRADRLTIRWADEFPTMLHFEHEEWGYEGTFMLAPRIQSDG